MTKNNIEDTRSGEEKFIITAPIVLKNFTRKDGKKMNFSEMYLQRSIKDYYIKFCESKVTRKKLEDHLNKIESVIKTLTLEVEFLEGAWDICDENEEQQSRTGEYVIIHRIVKE